MTIEEKIKAIEHIYRKCPDVLTSIDAARWTRMSKNTILALIREEKLVAYTYRGKWLISKVDLIEYLAPTTDDEAPWQKRIRERNSRNEQE